MSYGDTLTQGWHRVHSPGTIPELPRREHVLVVSLRERGTCVYMVMMMYGLHGYTMVCMESQSNFGLHTGEWTIHGTTGHTSSAWYVPRTGAVPVRGSVNDVMAPKLNDVIGGYIKDRR